MKHLMREKPSGEKPENERGQPPPDTGSMAAAGLLSTTLCGTATVCAR